jgi:hypothetical protein
MWIFIFASEYYFFIKDIEANVDALFFDYAAALNTEL